MYTKYNTKPKGSKIFKDPLNYSIFPVKSTRTKSIPKTIIRTTPHIKASSSKQKPQIPRNDLMYNLAMSNMVKLQDSMQSRPIIANCLSMSNIEDKKNEEGYLNDSNELIQQCYRPEPLPQKTIKNSNEPPNSYHQNKLNDRKLLYTLKTLDLENLFIAFNVNAITFNDLFLLSKEDLLELRIPLGPRNRLLHFAEEYKKIAKDYDYKELTEFFQRNKCFLINYVQDFSCSNTAGAEAASGYPKMTNDNSILLSPKGNSRQPYHSIVNHISSLNNLSSINLNSNINVKEEIEVLDFKSNNKQLSNRLIPNFDNCNERDDKDSEKSNQSLLKGLSCTNSQKSTLAHNESNGALPKKSNINHFFYQQNSNSSTKEIRSPINLIKEKEERHVKHMGKNEAGSNSNVQKYLCPMPSLNQSNTSLPSDNHNNYLQMQTMPLTIANIEEPIQRSGSELFENSPRDSQSIACSENKNSVHNKSDISTNPTSKQTTGQKTKNKTQIIQTFQNIFFEVEQYQHQYESMKQKNEQRKAKMNSLITRKKEDSMSRISYTQPRNYQISLGKEDLYNESERNLNDELSKLYDSEIKTSSNTSIQQHRYYGTGSNKDNNSRFFYETDYQTQK